MKMNETLNHWYAAFIVVLSPLVPLVTLVFIASLADAITYKMVLRKNGQLDSFSLLKYWKGIFVKTVLYIALIGGVFLIELNLGKHLLGYFEAEKWYLLPTRIIATMLVWHEIKSIDRNYKEAKGVSFIKKGREYLKGILSFKEKIENNIKK